MSDFDMMKRYQDIINRDEILNEEPLYVEVNEDSLNESRSTNIIGIMKEITQIPSVEKRVDVWSQADGMAGLFRTTDGNAYEIVIRPAEHSKHEGFKRYTK